MGSSETIKWRKKLDKNWLTQIKKGSFFKTYQNLTGRVW